MPFNNFRMASIFGQKPEPSTDSFGGLQPQKRFFSNSGPEPATPWSQLFSQPKFQAPELGNAGPMAQNDTQGNDMMGGDFMSRIQQLQRPGPAMTAYQEGLSEQPQYQDYQPSKWRILASTIGGAAGGLAGGAESGARIAENINQMPYARARQDWSDRMAGMGESAKIEADQTQNMSKAYNDYITRGQANRKFDYDVWKGEQDLNLERDKLNQPKFEKIESADGIQIVDLTGRVPPKNVTGMPIAMVNAWIAQQNADTNTRNAGTREGQLGVAQYNAQTGRMGTEGNLGLRRDELANTQSNQAFNQQMDINKFMKPEPNEMGQAYGMALRYMAQEPAFSPFIDQNADGTFSINKSANQNSPVYQTFINELRKRASQNQNQFGAPGNTFGGGYLATPGRQGFSLGPAPGAKVR